MKKTPGNYPEESIEHSEKGESLKSRIIHLYGEETARHIRLFEKKSIPPTYPPMKIVQTVFWKVGIKNSDAGELPRRKHTAFSNM